MIIDDLAHEKIMPWVFSKYCYKPNFKGESSAN